MSIETITGTDETRAKPPVWQAPAAAPAAPAAKPPNMTNLMGRVDDMMGQVASAKAKNADNHQNGGGGNNSGYGGSGAGQKHQNNVQPQPQPQPQQQHQQPAAPNTSNGSGQMPANASYNPTPPVSKAGAGSNINNGNPNNAPSGNPPVTAPGNSPDTGNGSNDNGTPATPSTTTPSTTTPSTTTPSTSSGSPGVTKNSGGVDQANAVSGKDPNSTTSTSTGGADNRTYNITNTTGQAESFQYSANGVKKGSTLTLQPGQTGTILGDASDVGVRISPSDASGNSPSGVVLYEDGAGGSGEAAGAENPDVSEVDGKVDAAGNPVQMTVTLSDGRTAGDGDAIRAYQYPTDDAAAMGLAGDTSQTVNIVLSS